MSVTLILIILVLAAGFYMSWNIGANDVSNAMGTSVGSGALTLRRAVIIAAILEFSGAFLLGSNVSETLQQGIIEVDHFAANPSTLLIGMFSALLATSVWLQVASYFGWPVSTTHAIVGAILGFGVVIGGFDAIHWAKVGSIASSWVISPILSGIVAYIFFTAVQRKVLFAFHPVEATKKLIPPLVFIVILTFFLTTGYSGVSNLGFKVPLVLILLGAFIVAAIAALIAGMLVRRESLSGKGQTSVPVKHMHQMLSLNKALRHLQRLKISSSGDTRKEVSNVLASAQSLSDKMKANSPKKASSDYQVVERMFAGMQILSACFVAFAHGANDVANAIGPVASAISIIQHPQDFAVATKVPIWLLGMGGLGIVVGLATWGWRVIETIGKKITMLTPTRGFCAEFGAAATILIASKLGLPVSTTHCIVGAVFGVGLAKGISALNLRMIKDIIMSWIVTIPSSAVACIIFYLIIKAIVGNTPLV